MILTRFDRQYVDNLRQGLSRRRRNQPGVNDRCKCLGVSPGTIRHQADMLMRQRASMSMDDACNAILDRYTDAR